MTDNPRTPTPEEYDTNIRRSVPRYDAMLGDVVDVVAHSGVKVERWVDVGSGTGNLVLLAMRKFPSSRFTLLDISSEMLAVAGRKVGSDRGYVCGSSDRMDLPDSIADVVSCVQSNHYYDAEGRERALSECHRILRPGGMVIVTEHVAPLSGKGYEITRARQKDFLLDNCRSDSEAEVYLDRYGTEYFPLTVTQHIEVMKKAGFTDVEVFYYSYGQVGLFGFRH